MKFYIYLNGRGFLRRGKLIPGRFSTLDMNEAAEFDDMEVANVTVESLFLNKEAVIILSIT